MTNLKLKLNYFFIVPAPQSTGDHRINGLLVLGSIENGIN